MVIYSREDWGARPPKVPLSVADEPGDSFVVHHTGGGAAPASVDEAFEMLRGIQLSHQNGEYFDIAYNMAVDNFGNLYECRGMEALGGATYGHNSHTRAIVWLGSSDVTTPSNAALKAIADFYKSQVGINLTSDASITGHRDWVATACPGETLYSQLPVIRNFVLDNGSLEVPPAPPIIPPTAKEKSMSLTVIPTTLRPVQFNGRSVLDMWISPSDITLGTTRVASAVVIMPADPSDAANPTSPLKVEVHQAIGGRYAPVQTITVPPEGVAVTTNVGGRVAVVFDPAKPILVHGREVHYT